MKHFRFAILAMAILPMALLSSCGPKKLSDKDILTLIYNQAGGENWSDSRKEGWLTENLADWTGVKVNEEGRVTELTIYDAKGVIPAEISGLTELEDLYLSMENGEGDPENCLPSSIGKLEKLTSLHLKVKNPCAVPPLDNLNNLEKLWLSFDEADYPAAVGSRNLVNLDLYGFVGEIPHWVYEMGALERLDIEPDRLDAGISPEISNLQNLKYLQVDYSQFIGAVDAPNTELPTEAIFSIQSLETVFIRGASTSGTLPASIGDMPNLRSLSLIKLGLTGELPKELGNLPKIETLKLYNNEFTGEIPAELGNAVTLKTLWLDKNHLTGPLPKSFGKLVNLESLNVSDNKLSGKIPAELGKCTKLGKGVFTKFSKNEFDPEIPSALKELDNFKNIEF